MKTCSAQLEHQLAQSEYHLAQLGDWQTEFLKITCDLEVDEVVSKNMKTIRNMSGIDFSNIKNKFRKFNITVPLSVTDKT